MKHTTPFALALLLACGCQSTQEGALEHTMAEGLTSEDFVPPQTLDTERLHLEPLGPQHAQRDYDAFMSSREHLLETMGWGSWPRADMTVEENRGDLERHETEFVDRVAYAYTVLTPDRSECRGCIYLRPLDDAPRGITLAYWVTADGVTGGLDAELLDGVVAWLDAEWPVDRIVQRLHAGNDRGATLAAERGFVKGETDGDRTAWTLDLR